VVCISTTPARSRIQDAADTDPEIPIRDLADDLFGLGIFAVINMAFDKAFQPCLFFFLVASSSPAFFSRSRALWMHVEAAAYSPSSKLTLDKLEMGAGS